MSKRIEKILTQHVTNNFIVINKILNYLEKDENELIEIIGESGTGKSYIFNSIHQALKQKNIPFEIYIPFVFKYNQLKEIVKLTTDISDEKFDEIISQTSDYDFSNRYDFFYFLTEKLSELNLFKPKTIIIFECFHLDNYTTDFIQFLIQFSEKVKIKFINFTREETFSFSQKIQLDFPDSEEIRQILAETYPNKKKNYVTESEIISNISSGNFYVIEYILDHFFKGNKTIDLQSYLDKKISFDTIYAQRIKELTKSQEELLLAIFVLDTRATTQNLQQLLKSKSLEKDLKYLAENDLIFELDKNIYLKKVSPVKTYFFNLTGAIQKKYFKDILKDMRDETLLEYCINVKDCTFKKIEPAIQYLKNIQDYYNLRKIYESLLSKAEKPETKIEILKNLGIANLKLDKAEDASDNFRQALKICISNSFPAEEIVYNLAKSLFSQQSSPFALEIIKKYSPASITKYWKCKITLLKAEILMQTEQYKEAIKNVDEAFQIADQISNLNERSLMKADDKKLKGLIFYFSNELEKAETEFTDAENLYKTSNNLQGLAAIYNNLGGLATFQGEWKNAEALYLQSLEVEKQRYNLEGISICYNNLGSILEDEGNYDKALYYLNEALEIQKLLNNKYEISTFHYNIGITYMDLGEYEKATHALNQALKNAITFKLYKSEDAALNALGALNFKMGDWTAAIDYYQQAIKKSKENNFLDGLCQSYNNLGELYEKRGEYNLAYDFYSKSVELLSNISDEFMKAEVHGNLGSVLTRLHKFGEAYKYLVESFDFFKKLNAKVEILEGAQKQAYYFLQTRNIESANYYLDTALKIAEELNDDYQIGKCFYLKTFLERDNTEQALKLLKQAIEKFIKTNNNFDLGMANYEYALLLFENEDWEQALQILNDNKKIIKKFDAIKFLEKNDILIQKINKKYAIELKESKQHESLLNEFYEITQNLNAISDFDVLLETALDKLVGFAEADGGLFCLYYNQQVKDSWEYVIFDNYSYEKNDFSQMMEIIKQTYGKNKSQNYKQPHFAPEYNNIISFPLSIRNEIKGVICLFTKYEAHYFSEKMYNLINALCNQIVVIVENISYASLQESHAEIREQLATAGYFGNIIGKSDKIQDIFRLIEKIKDTPTTVLLEGSSGTGKELFARAIHFNSNRKNKKFVAQYCGALPETLLESELFGHIKGSFTGAIHDKRGLFEIADGGTFFLDEISDISLSTQAKLLRFLQEGEIKKVGSTRTEKVDVRVICATNASLQEKVEKGEFREDLYYRLNVIRIDVPTLKERRSDIPLLAIYFLDNYCKKINKKINGITDEAMKYLINYDWPGNIRQLENEIERAVTLADDDSFIKSSDLTDEIFKFQEIAETISLLEKQSLKGAVEKLEKQMILKILDETNWNQTKTAQKLELSRQGLIKKMQRYKIVK